MVRSTVVRGLLRFCSIVDIRFTLKGVVKVTSVLERFSYLFSEFLLHLAG